MKIGILTYHCVTNFGAQLQTLSTIGYIRQHGHEPIVLNWFPYDLEEFYLRQHPRVQFDEQFNFAMDNMPLSRICRSLEDLCHVIDEQRIDAILLGSDALFDYTPIKKRQYFSLRKFRLIKEKVTSNHDLPNPFWGSFNDYVKKKVPYCGFSISSQNMPYFELTNDETKELRKLLNGFTSITTRDEWTKDLVTYISGRTDVYVTPDPVFAFNYNTNYCIDKKELLKKYGLPSQYILISFLYDILPDDFINQIINNIEESTGISCVSFPMPRKLKSFKTQYKIELPLPTLDWYYLIKYSNGYIGELMHPIIVCLHNSVPFFSFDQYGTYKTIIPKVWRKFIPESSKIYDILKRGELTDNMWSYLCEIKMTPKIVSEKFVAFDKSKCKLFADLQYKRYCEGMDNAIKSLTNNCML